jgi:tripeptidyl-peptidase-1
MLATGRLRLIAFTMRFSLVAVTSLLAGAIAAPTANSKRHVVHERRGRLPTHWRKDTEIHGDAVLPMRIALSQSNLHQAEEFLMDVSHPESPNFGKHWSAKQVAETFAPSQEAVASVLEWLADAGITGDRVKQSQGLNWIHTDVTVAEAESLLKTKYYKYTHAQSGQAHVACEVYSIPEDIQRHVDFVTPTVHFDAKLETPKKRRTVEQRTSTSTRGHSIRPGIGHSIGSPGGASLPKEGGKIPFGKVLNELENCDTSIVPDCLRALYLFPPSFPANPKSKFANLMLLDS